MKKIIFLCISSILSTGIFATALPDPGTSAKIMKLFHQVFPEVIQPQIKKVGDYYWVYFKDIENNSSSRIIYDADGKILETLKYYSCEQLAPFIRSKVIAEFVGKKIIGVTEVDNELEHYYQIVLQDSKLMFVVNADINGNILIEKKYKRG